ncbi:MAG: hypothetical protein HZB15_07040, partial [Actinobacteria bacterium]|nr:hypothetical protein [Actinomycetota bacterium]
MTIELDDDLDALEHRLRAACRAVVPHLLDVSLVESSDERFVGAPDAEVVDHDADSQRRRLLPAAAAVLVLVGVAAVWSTRDQPTRDTDRTDAPAAATTIATVATSSADVQITTSTLPDPPNAGPCTESGCAGFDPLPVTPGAT